MSLYESVSIWLRLDQDSARHSQKVGWTPISKTSFNALHSPGVFTNQSTFCPFCNWPWLTIKKNEDVDEIRKNLMNEICSVKNRDSRNTLVLITWKNTLFADMFFFIKYVNTLKKMVDITKIVWIIRLLVWCKWCQKQLCSCEKKLIRFHFDMCCPWCWLQNIGKK